MKTSKRCLLRPPSVADILDVFAAAVVAVDETLLFLRWRRTRQPADPTYSWPSTVDDPIAAAAPDAALAAASAGAAACAANSFS